MEDDFVWHTFNYHFRIHIVYDILDKNRSNQLITCSIFLAYVFGLLFLVLEQSVLTIACLVH